MSGFILQRVIVQIFFLSHMRSTCYCVLVSCRKSFIMHLFHKVFIYFLQTARKMTYRGNTAQDVTDLFSR